MNRYTIFLFASLLVAFLGVVACSAIVIFAGFIVGAPVANIFNIFSNILKGLTAKIFKQ